MTFSEFMATLLKIRLILQDRILILIMPAMFWLDGLNTVYRQNKITERSTDSRTSLKK
ncbi:hypothetical protein M993_02264 [Obesumbacterium proteus ATCC 12841]|uniref:Uncharacterized protein n=1 Tax=Obesumbacterium proteus ATCC 12841 TaxID=1354268 RepID=A0AA91IPU1_9GAMM|nr:hypothetical protein M993_02264 [Obesumbacterium proteus ATCC 12841]